MQFATQLAWMLESGGLAACAKRCASSAEQLSGWAEQDEFAIPFVADPARRWNVVAPGTSAATPAGTVTGHSASDGGILDVNGGAFHHGA